MHQEILTGNIAGQKQLNAIKANDEAFLKDFYQNNYHKVEAYVLKNNGSVDEAKDIFQEAFIAVWRNIQLNKFKPGNETSLSGYLYQIAKNKWLDHLRSSHHKKVIPIDDAPIFEEGSIPEEESRYIGLVSEGFKHLGKNCKEVLIRFYYKKDPLKEIAKSFGWTEATVRNNKYRCLQQLRDSVKDKRHS